MVSAKNNADKKIKIILLKLLEEYELGAFIAGGDIRINTRHFLTETGIDENQFIAILKTLESKAVISSFLIHRNDYEDNKLGGPDLICFIKISRLFKARVEDYFDTLSEGEPVEKIAPGSIVYLTESGDLWHGDREQFCYSMRQMKERLSIVKYLIKHKGYQSTRSLAENFGKDEQGIRTTINKIQTQINTHLDIPDLIENNPGPGYRINPKYQIKETK